MTASSAGAFGFIIYLAIVVLVIAGWWKMFVKAGHPGWWLVLFLIPIVNIVIWLIVSIDIAKAFGKGTGFGVLFFFFQFICAPILGFGSTTYDGAPAVG